MRIVISLACLLITGACGLPAKLEPSSRNEIALVTSDHQDRLVRGIQLRLSAGQVLVPVRADNREEFCTFHKAIFSSSGPQGRSCFYDPNNSGRFSQAFMNFQTRAYPLEANIPYTRLPFPCENCSPPLDVDIREIANPAQLASLSIAPTALRPMVVLALQNDPAFDAALAQHDAANAQQNRLIVQIAAREVRHRQAIAKCTDLFSPVAAAFVPFGGFVAMAASAEEQGCVEEFMRTGRVPTREVPAMDVPGRP